MKSVQHKLLQQAPSLDQEAEYSFVLETFLLSLYMKFPSLLELRVISESPTDTSTVSSSAGNDPFQENDLEFVESTIQPCNKILYETEMKEIDALAQRVLKDKDLDECADSVVLYIYIYQRFKMYLINTKNTYVNVPKQQSCGLLTFSMLTWKSDSSGLKGLEIGIHICML